MKQFIFRFVVACALGLALSSTGCISGGRAVLPESTRLECEQDQVVFASEAHQKDMCAYEDVTSTDYTDAPEGYQWAFEMGDTLEGDYVLYAYLIKL